MVSSGFGTHLPPKPRSSCGSLCRQSSRLQPLRRNAGKWTRLAILNTGVNIVSAFAWQVHMKTLTDWVAEFNSLMQDRAPHTVCE